MENIIIVLVVLFCVCSALIYILKKKKQGAKCIGCPYAKNCGKCTCEKMNK